MIDFVYSTNCVGSVCRFLKSLTSYDITYYGLLYLSIMILLFGLLYKKVLQSLKYFYSLSFILVCFAVISYQLLLLGTINLYSLPLSLKIFVSSLFALLIYTSLYDNAQNNKKNLAFELAPVKQQPKIMETKSNKNTYNYNYNNDCKYSEPNTTNAKVSSDYGYNYIAPNMPSQTKEDKQEDKKDNNKENEKNETTCPTRDKSDNTTTFAILNEKINDKTLALQDKISNIKSRLEAMEERKQTEIENQLVGEINAIKKEMNNLKHDIAEMEARLKIEQTSQNERPQIINVDKKLEKAGQDNQKNFENVSLTHNDFSKALSTKIDNMIEKINNQKQLENQKIYEEHKRQASEMEEKYKAQLRRFEQQLVDIDEQINQNEKLDERVKQISTTLNTTPIVKTENLPAISTDNKAEATKYNNTLPTTETKKATTITTERTENIASNLDLSSEEQKSIIKNEVLKQTQALIQQSITPMNEKIVQMENNITELNNGMQGIIDRVAKLLEFMTTTMKKQS